MGGRAYIPPGPRTQTSLRLIFFYDMRFPLARVEGGNKGGVAYHGVLPDFGA